MRLALKLVVMFMLANIALACAYGYLAIRREVKLFERRIVAEAEEVEPIVEKVLTDAWRAAGDPGIKESLRRIIVSQQQPLSIRWVWIDTKADVDFCPAVSADRLTAMALQEHVAIETDEPDGIADVHVYWPVALGTDRQGALEFTHPMTELDADKREIIARTVMLVSGMALISGLLAIFLGVRLVGRPLELLIAKARRIGRGDLEGPVRLTTHDELAELADDLNLMCANLNEAQVKLRQETVAKITALEQLRHADRLQTVGRLAAGIAHELGTPLNVVAGRAGLISSGKLDGGQISESAVAIKTEADKMTRIIRQLLDFARASAPRKMAVDLRTVIRQTIDMIDSIAEKQNVELIYSPEGEDAVAEIDASQIQQVLANLTINAIQAMPGGGQVTFALRGRMQPPPNGNGLGHSEFYAIEVHDQGIGIPEELKQQIFEPFFTTKEVGAGTGLGLSIAYGIVREHGGWIDVRSKVGEGSCFTVYLPAGAKP